MFFQFEFFDTRLPEADDKCPGEVFLRWAGAVWD
jgi:hypothetical protein